MESPKKSGIDLAQALKDLQSMKDQLQKRDKKRDKEIQKRDEEIQKRDEEIQKRDKEIQSMKDQLQQKDEEIQKREEDLQSMKDQLQQKDEEIRSLKSARPKQLDASVQCALLETPVDPVTFFTQVHSVPGVLNKIMDYVQVDEPLWECPKGFPDWEYHMNFNWWEANNKFRFYLLPTYLNDPDSLGQATVDRMVQLVWTRYGFEGNYYDMNVHKFRPFIYRPPGRFAVSTAWSAFMQYRASVGKEKNHEFMQRLQEARRTVGMMGPPVELAWDCSVCDEVLLHMAGVEDRRSIVERKVRQRRFCTYGGIFIDLCGRHHEWDCEDWE